MKKLRFQPTFASLTEAELEQLAHEVQRETYDAVRERICKPRSEGGLDLHFTSNSPLVRLHTKKNRLDLINAQITSGQKLTLAQLDTFTAGDSGPCGEHRAPEEVHDAIMSATYVLVTEQDNTPHQLLALQRLADFPARAEYREQSAAIRAERMDLARSKEIRAQAKEQRAAEMHTHKINIDLRKQERADRAEQRATERLDLAKRSFTLREQEPQRASSSNSVPQSDHLGPLAKNWEDVRKRAQKAFGITPEESARRAELRRTWKDPYEQDQVTPESSGAQMGFPCADDTQSGQTVSEPAASSEDSADSAGGLNQITTATLNPVHPVQNPFSPSASSASSALKSEIKNQKSEIESLSPADLAARVDRYTVDRIREYIAHNQKHTPWPYRHPAPEFITEERHCPCGHACPCPTHETIPDVGPFPPIFWKITPFNSDYALCLQERNLPFRRPDEYLP